MNRIKATRTVATLCIILLSLAVAPRISAETAIQVLEFISYPHFMEFFEWVSGEFEKVHPGFKVTYNYLGFSQTRERILVGVAAGVPPHVARVSSVWMGEFLDGQLLEPWKATDITDAELKRIVPSILVQAMSQGRLYGLPIAFDAQSIFYDKNAFHEQGLGTAPEAMANWEDLKTFAARSLKRTPDGDVTRYGFAFRPYLMSVSSFLYSNGVRFLEEGLGGARAGFHTPNGIRTLEYLAEIQRYSHPKWSHARFSGRETAMIMTSVQTASWFRGENASLDFGVTSVPPGPAGKQRKSIIWGQMYAIPKGAPDQEAAKEFIRFFNSLPIQAAGVAQLRVLESPRTDIFRTPEFAALLKDEPWAQYLSELLATAEPALTHAKRGDIERIWNDLIPPVINGQASVTSALSEAERLINRLLEK